MKTDDANPGTTRREPDPDLGARLVRLCQMTDEPLKRMTAAEQLRASRLHLAIARGPNTRQGFLCLEDQILVLLEWCHHPHSPAYFEAACQLVQRHASELDWKDLTEWADRINVEWAISRLRKCIRIG
jgi:hypothetical protein